MAVLAVVLGGYLFMSWAGQPSYVPLFSNLSSSDAAAITQKLATNKIPYELAEGGEQIMVPESDVYQQRLDMAAIKPWCHPLIDMQLTQLRSTREKLFAQESAPAGCADQGDVPSMQFIQRGVIEHTFAVLSRRGEWRVDAMSAQRSRRALPHRQYGGQRA